MFPEMYAPPGLKWIYVSWSSTVTGDPARSGKTQRRITSAAWSIRTRATLTAPSPITIRRSGSIQPLQLRTPAAAWPMRGRATMREHPPTQRRACASTERRPDEQICAGRTIADDSGHAIAGRLDHHLVRRPQALAKPFKCSPCHVDPAGMSKDAHSPK